MERFGVTEEQIRDQRFTPEFRNLMHYEVGYARQLFEDGLPLLDRVDRELAVDLRLFSRGGQEILHAIARQNYDVLRSRPVISKPRKAALLLRAVAAKLTARQAA
jgi:phytoene/squalene synthetase